MGMLQRRLDMRHQSSRDHGKNKAKLYFVIFEVQSSANWCKLCTIQFWENISGQKKLLRATRHS